MSPSIYVETTVLGYFTARPTGDVLGAARRQVTREWWASRRHAFALYGSDLVLAEVAAGAGTPGDPGVAAHPLEAARELTLLPLTSDAAALARALQAGARLPGRAAATTAHVALAAVHGVGFLLTWDVRLLANAELRRPIEVACRAAGYVPPVVATPDHLIKPLDW